jgi:hypothetical protein
MNPDDLVQTAALRSAAELPKTKPSFVAGEVDNTPSVDPERKTVSKDRQKWKESAYFDFGQPIQLEAPTPFLELVLGSPQSQGSDQKTWQPHTQPKAKQLTTSVGPRDLHLVCH